MNEPPVNAMVRRARELLAAYEEGQPRGGGHLPESPYELLRECKAWIEKLADMLASECQENAMMRPVVEAARLMPRTTPKPGGASTMHDYKIEASAAWGLDHALKRLDAARTRPMRDQEDKS